MLEHFTPTAVAPTLPQIRPYRFVLDEVRDQFPFRPSKMQRYSSSAQSPNMFAQPPCTVVQQWLLIPIDRMISNRKGFTKCCPEVLE